MCKRNAWKVEKTDFDAENDNGAAYPFIDVKDIFSYDYYRK